MKKSLNKISLTIQLHRFQAKHNLQPPRLNPHKILKRINIRQPIPLRYNDSSFNNTNLNKMYNLNKLKILVIGP